MKFGPRLRALRKQAGLSQEQLALACGWSGQSRIANYESAGKSARAPSLDDLPLLARGLGVPVAAFFDAGIIEAQRGLAVRDTTPHYGQQISPPRVFGESTISMDAAALAALVSGRLGLALDTAKARALVHLAQMVLNENSTVELTDALLERLSDQWKLSEGTRDATR